VNLHFALLARAGALRVPASAPIFDNRGFRLATVDAQDAIRFRSVAILQDLGNAGWWKLSQEPELDDFRAIWSRPKHRFNPANFIKEC
jgi:hypothetical protein